jgi:hypothetical protein
VPEKFKKGDIVEVIVNSDNCCYADTHWKGSMGPFRVFCVNFDTLVIETLDGKYLPNGYKDRFRKVGINSKEDMEALYVS